MNNDIQEAINLFQSNKLNLAENKMIDLTKKYPNNHILFNLYGIILAGQNKLEDSINKYKKSIQINQNLSTSTTEVGAKHHNSIVPSLGLN